MGHQVAGGQGGDPADFLIAASENIDLLVCGSRGYGPRRAVLLGGVSRRVTTEAHCPVIVLARGAEAGLDALIGEQAGVIHALVRFVQPVLRPLFPEIPRDHPALSMIALNLTANIFGLGNAATPFGIKAMEELQTLNPRKDTATNSMVMLLAINTASVQLMPPVLLLALLGLQVNQLIFPIVLTTGLSLIVAIVAARVYGRLPANRASDPMAQGAEPAGPAAGSES